MLPNGHTNVLLPRQRLISEDAIWQIVQREVAAGWNMNEALHLALL